MPRTKDRRSDLLTVEQVADYLQLNKLTVYKYIRDGRLPAARLGKAYRIRLSDVDAFLERQMSRPAARSSVRAAAGRSAALRQAAVRMQEVAVAPPRRESPPRRQPGDVSINPMEWVIRGLH